MSKRYSMGLAISHDAPRAAPRAEPAAPVDPRLNTKLHAELITTRRFRASTLASATAALARVRQQRGG